jgi:hypothetical protein
LGNALQAASIRGHPEIVALLLDKCTNIDVEHTAADQPHVEQHDHASSVASYQSLQSIFSTRSINLSVSSTRGPFISAMERFVELSAQREDLVALLKHATVTMSQEKFTRNNARMLRALSKQVLASETSQGAKLAGRVLHGKSKRLKISAWLFAHYSPDGPFQQAKLLPVLAPLHERIQDYHGIGTNGSGLVTVTPIQDRAVSPQTPQGQAELDSELSAASSAGSEDEADDYQHDPDGLAASVLSSDAFSWYVRNLRLFLHPVTPQLLFETARHGDVKRVGELLEDALGSASKTQPDWLEELVDLDLSTLQIAQFLVDKETRVPWIFSNFHFASETPPATSFQQPNYVQNALAILSTARLGSPDQGFIKGDTAFDLHGQLQLRKDIARLCGLAGILPISRNLRELDGTVDFEHDQGQITATLSYRVDGDDSEDSICVTQRLLKICHKLQNAVGLFQKSGICCSTFTILHWNDTSVEIYEIQVAIVLHLALLIGQTTADAVGAQRLGDFANKILEMFDPRSTRSGEAETTDIGSLLMIAMHRASVALQLLCLGFLSYSRGHAGELRPFFWEHSVHKFQLCGLDVVGHEAMHMLAQRVPLSVLLADNLPAYVRATSGIGEVWKTHESSILRALRTGRMDEFLNDDEIVAHQQDIRKLFHGVLHNL